MCVLEPAKKETVAPVTALIFNSEIPLVSSKIYSWGDDFLQIPLLFTGSSHATSDMPESHVELLPTHPHVGKHIFFPSDYKIKSCEGSLQTAFIS